MTTKIVAKTAVFDKSGNVLLLRRSPTDTRRPGEWDFPGGGVDKGEDLVAGAVREIEEEAGIEIPIDEMRLVYTATEVYELADENVCRLLFVTCTKGTDVILSYEHDQYRWVSVDEALADFPHPFYGRGLAYARDNGLLPK